MVNWDEYRLILALHRSGTLRGAATDLGVTHTTVARRLDTMQANKSEYVFERFAGSYRLTALGMRLLEVAEKMEKAAFAGMRHERALSVQIEGPIRLSMPDVVTQYLLLDSLAEFTDQYPGIELTVASSYQIADLDRLDADIVIRNMQTPQDHLVGRRLFPNYVTYYANPEYLDATPPEHLRWIAPADVSLWPDWLETSPFPNAPVAPLVIDDIAARHHAIVAGLGLGRGACFMADPELRLVRLCDSEPVAQSDFWVLTHPDLRETPRIQILMRFLIAAMLDKKDLVLGKRPQGTPWIRRQRQIT